MTYKKYVNGIARTFSGFAPNNNARKPLQISKFEREYPESQRVVALNVPTQYQRAAILKQAQAFEEFSHADLIRID